MSTEPQGKSIGATPGDTTETNRSITKLFTPPTGNNNGGWSRFWTTCVTAVRRTTDTGHRITIRRKPVRVGIKMPEDEKVLKEIFEASEKFSDKADAVKRTFEQTNEILKKAIAKK